MRGQTHFISQFRVRSHFGAAFSSRPFLGGRNEHSTKPLSSIFGIDEPALQIPDVIAFAILDKGSYAGFQKTGKLAIPRIRDYDELSIRVVKDIKHFSLVEIGR